MGLLTSFTRGTTGSRQFTTFVEPFPFYVCDQTPAAFPVANAAYFVRFRVEEPIAVAAIEFYCATPSGAPGTIDGGIYTSDFTTWTKVQSSASQPTVASGWNTVTLAGTAYLVPTVDYWAGGSCSETTSTFAKHGIIGAAFGGRDSMGILKGSMLPMAATFTGPTNGGSFMPYMRLRS